MSVLIVIQLIRFHGYCDISIIRGVLAILIQLAEGKKAKEVDLLDVDELFSRLHLDEYQSPIAILVFMPLWL